MAPPCPPSAADWLCLAHPAPCGDATFGVSANALAGTLPTDPTASVGFVRTMAYYLPAPKARLAWDGQPVAHAVSLLSGLGFVWRHRPRLLLLALFRRSFTWSRALAGRTMGIRPYNRDALAGRMLQEFVLNNDRTVSSCGPGIYSDSAEDGGTSLTLRVSPTRSLGRAGRSFRHPLRYYSCPLNARLRRHTLVPRRGHGRRRITIDF